MTNRCDVTRTPYRDFAYPRITTTTGAGGTWSSEVEAFHVAEIPLYPFLGEGEHAALVVEKRGVTTRDVAAGVAARLDLSPAAIGYAGMKDKASVAVQSFTVTGIKEETARSAFEAEGCRVLSATRHRNKLRLGHLVGNHFRLRLAGADVASARTVLETLASVGAPNYVGPQRFGGRGDNAAAGVRLLQGTQRAGRWKRDLLVSATQSLVFNEILARRVEGGTWNRALPGDVLRREDSGGLFVCEDPVVDGARAAAFEVTPTGSLPGSRAPSPQGTVAELEGGVLDALGLSADLFRRENGSRRPLRVRLGSWSADEEGDGVWLSFSLPAGAFATSVVREVVGGDAPRV
ncbi:MAG: tRNA pseudouridine(13) synthase TruD [Deltaproteobacteria bacterium]|nr:tRNA pseudouridine(13) synthase TruD [Deltaproteobacteria bacterium]